MTDISTPLNISNGTPSASPESVPQDVKGQPLPINQLKGTPPLEECSDSNVHRSKSNRSVTRYNKEIQILV
jgi:hypothetical protein